MAQANIKSTTRRAVLAGIALSPAVVLPAFATSHVGRNDDAELLALRPALEAVIAERSARLALDAERDERFEAACEAAGLPRKEHPLYEPGPEWEKAHEEHIAYVNKRDAVRASIMDPEWAREDAIERNGGPSFWDDFNERQFAVIDKVMNCQPTTVAGLAVIARCASLLSESTIGSDLNHTEYEDLVRIILDFTDTEPVTD